MPSSTPATAPMATAMTPTVIDVRAPAITRARTSRPYWSVPKGWELDGASRRATIDMASGSVGVHARLTTATVISASVSSTPSEKVTCRQGRRLLMAETRIERAVRQVHQEVDRDDAGRDEERDALHHRQVARGDGAEGQAAEARKHEHRLEDDAAGEELADLEAGDCHDGDQRVAQRVLDDDHALGHALRSGRPHVVAAHGVGEPVDVLDDEGAIEPQRRSQPCGRFRIAFGAHDDLRGIAGKNADHDEDEEGHDEEGGDERGHPPAEVLPHVSAGRYLAGAHDTSERSADGIGRSFHNPCTPFLATASRGCMKRKTTGASSTSCFCICT